MVVSKKSRLLASIFAGVLGFAGIDLFYIGKTKLAILQCILYGVYLFLALILAIITFTVFPYAFLITMFIGFVFQVWPIIRLILTLCGKATDNYGDIITEWKPN